MDTTLTLVDLAGAIALLICGVHMVQSASQFRSRSGGFIFPAIPLWPTQRSQAAYAARFPGPNDSGNSSPNVTVRRRPSESQMCTGVVS